MKSQTKANWQTIVVASIAIFIVLGASSVVFAQKGVGAKYGSRDPRTCEDMKTPARGAITAALATKYFICAAEKEDGRYLDLVDNVKLEVGAGRPYNPGTHINLPQVDVRFPIYPIRGSHTLYQCNPESDQYLPGKNCHRYEHKNAEGECYKNTFGDWRCYMRDLNIPSRNVTLRVAPPKGDAAGNKEQVNDKPVETKTGNQPADTKQTTITEDTKEAGKDANGIAKPDFSELEKDFEIMRYEYDTSTRPPAIYVYAKVKKSNGGRSALSFEGRFYDADGINVMVPAERAWVLSGDPSKVGEAVKVRIWTPSEAQMQDKVKKIVIKRIVE